MIDFPGTLIVVDGMDGAGKGTLLNALQQRIAHRKHLVATEPTFRFVGSVIREELIANHSGFAYSGKTVATAFALDRDMLYSRMILPYLAEHPDSVVLQDRGLITSLAYQPLQDAEVTIEWLLSLHGNQVELSRPPDALVILHLDPEVARQRLLARRDKNDKAIFEQIEFMRCVAARYRDPTVVAPYVERGTRVVHVDAERSMKDVASSTIAQLADLLP
ncbi:MAG: hypothetical protein UY72_C0080G0013 [Candidatus Uhrbacteria bacterium GW2011_GWD2_52_7]|uniref:Thymidylate kinase n=1 Tax=Candidatus Uhrbacteria bacterium GW2011_GWD2_52_7 TaxID=1618989 RepID=A0A0G1XBH4_9BACT|nr:MAG: hypothetical protein UY72_C0080G0013 [Candidatus Uhrbacteria bacterium GW2011_GWD2_52_7]